MHIEKELVESKIAILRGRGSENNRLLLEIVALEGALIKYDLFKKAKAKQKTMQYPTVSRRIDDLLTKGYLQIVGERKITVGKREDKSPTYGLTWSGFIASLTLKSVAQNVMYILERNPQLQMPFPRELTFRVVRELFSEKELNLLAQSLLIGYLKAIPKDLEFLRPEQYPLYLLPAITEAPEIRGKIEQKDLSGLFQIPEVYEYFNKSLTNFEKALEDSLLGIRKIRQAYLSKALPKPNTPGSSNEACRESYHNDEQSQQEQRSGQNV